MWDVPEMPLGWMLVLGQEGMGNPVPTAKPVGMEPLIPELRAGIGTGNVITPFPMRHGRERQ